MAPYDSDDSLDEDLDYTETDVLLGYASKDPKDETISRLGGRPEWLDPSNPPSYALAKCKVCHAPLVQLLQLNGELPDRFPGHERRLYVLSCRNKGCRRKEGSVRALRATRVSAEATARAKERKEREERERIEKEKRENERKEKEKGLGEALFGVQKGTFGSAGGGSANPFSSGGSASSGNANPFAKPVGGAPANPFSTGSAGPSSSAAADEKVTPAAIHEDTAKDLPKTFAETLSLNNPQAEQPKMPVEPPEPWPQESELAAPYPVSYLADAEYETLDPVDPTPAQKVNVTSMDIDEGPSGSSGKGGGKEDKDVFESTIDATFQKFADRLAQNPDQCIRYEFGGVPLLYSKMDLVGKKLHDNPSGSGMPRCGRCGGPRAFEVQLTPQAIVELEGEEELEGMDWGTVIVGVCERDCVPAGVEEGQVGYVEEWARVQWEELTARR